MRGTDYFTLAFGSIVGVGWMVVLGDWLQRGGPVGAMLAYLIGGLALVPVVLVYGRMARAMPVSASEVAYTGAVFPPLLSFAAGWTMTFAYLIVCPYEAVAIGELAAYVFPEIMNQVPLYRIGSGRGATIYLPQLALGIGLTAAITWINYRGIRLSSRFQNWTTFGLLAVVAVFVPLGIWRGDAANWEPGFRAAPDDSPDPWLSILSALLIVPYFLIGFETIPKCAEEAAEGFDPRRFTRIMLVALASGTAFYVTVVGVVALLQPWHELQDERFATALAFERAFGWPWLVRVMIFGAALSLLKVWNGNFLAATRLLWAMGRRQLLGRKLGVVDERLQTPTAAILLVGGITVGATFLGRSVLVPISEIGSLAGTLGWLATCLAFCAGAGGQRTASDRILGAVGVALCLVFTVIAAGFLDLYLWIAAGLWLLLGVAIYLTGEPRPT
jgi:amino acid transporter